MDIRFYKLERSSKQTKEQAERSQKILRKLANLLYRSNCFIVIDGEKYFTFVGSFMPGNDNFYSDDRAECPDNVRYVGLEKFH